MDTMQNVLKQYRQRITLLRLLNRGGQGHVYKAMNGDEEVAVKVYVAQRANVEAAMDAADHDREDAALDGYQMPAMPLEQTDYERRSAEQELRAYERLRLEGI